MKYFILFAVFFLNCFRSNASIDSTIKINKISIIIQSSWPSMIQLNLNNNYNLIIDSSGNALLKWPQNCPPSRNNSLVCFFKGTINKRKFNSLVKFINKIDFINLNDKYEYSLKEEPIEDRGFEKFEIEYNDKVKSVVYERIDVEILNELKKRIEKIKKSIKWVAM